MVCPQSVVHNGRTQAILKHNTRHPVDEKRDEGAYLIKRFHPVHQQEELVGAMPLCSSRTNRSS